MKKNLSAILILTLIFQLISTLCFANGNGGAPYPFVAEYLFDYGLSLYKQGNLPEALFEFKKVLLVEPQHKKSLYYIQLIEGKKEPIPIKPITPSLRKIKPTLKEKRITKKKKVIPSELKIPEEKPKLPKEKVIQVEEIEVKPKIILPPKKKEIKKIGEKEVIEELFLEKMAPEKKEIPIAAVPKIMPKIEKVPSEIEEVPPEILREPIKRVGEIALFLDGEEVELESPILLREGEIFIPLKEITRLLSYSIFNLGEKGFRLISPEGDSREIKVSYLEGEPVITQDELKDYFSLQSQYDDLKKALYITTGRPSGEFKTYAIKRAKEEPLKKEIKPAPPIEEDTSKNKPDNIPEVARPSVELYPSVSYTYVKYHTTSPYKNLATSLSGRVDDFRVSGFREYKEMSGRFDHSSTWLRLDRPGLGIALFDQGINLTPLRGQYQGFTGIKLTKSWDNFNKTTFLGGGDANNYVSGSAGTVKYVGDMVGLEQEYWPRRWLGTKALILYLDNESESSNLSGTTNYPRRNILNVFDTTLKFTPKISLSNQLAYCYYNPDNARDEDVSDWDWRINPEIKTDRYNLKFAYEFLGDKYASVGNPSSYQDYKGYDLSGSYKVFDVWSLSGYFTRYQNNVEKDPTQVTNKNQSFSLSSAHRLPKDQSLNLSFSQSATNPSGPTPGPSTKFNFYRTDYFTRFLGQSFLLNYQYYQLGSPDETLRYDSHTAGGTIFKSFGLGSTWNLHQDFTKTFYETGTDKSDFTESFSIYYRLNPNLDFSFNPYYTWTKSEGTASTQTVSSSTGIRYGGIPDTSLHLDYSIQNYNLKTEKDKWPRNWSIMWSLIRHFSLSSPPRFGRIKGRVLQDINNNTKIDPSDEPAEGVKIKLEDGRIAKTDKAGNFSFLYVSPMKQKLSVDLEDLPIEWTSKELEKEISVAAFRTTDVQILLVKGSSISGRIFIDENKDGRFQDNEEPLEGIRVTLLPDEQIRFTDEEGNFKFEQVLLGRYKLRINVEDIPVGYELVSKDTLAILVLPNERNENLNFVIRLKPATPIQKF